MKNTKIWTIVSVAILTLQVVAEALTVLLVWQLDVLPTLYMGILLGVFAVFAAITGLLLFLQIKKKPVSTVRRIIAMILALLVVCGCALVAKVAADAYETIHAVTAPAEEADEESIYVFVRKDDPAQKLADTAAYPYGMIGEYDTENISKAIALIEQTTGSALALTEYSSTAEVVDALLNDQVDAVILNGVNVVLLTEEEGYEDLMNKVRILHTIPLDSLKEEPEPETNPDPEPTVPEEPKEITKDPFIFYVSGSDTRNKKFRISRSDVNILVVVNPVTKQVLLLNTPRDYYIPNPKGNGALDKLTHCGLYGAKCSMQALGDLYGIKVDYYAQINFTGFETLIDAVDGVTIYSDKSFTARDTKIKKGENYLNGAQALDLVRERYHVSGGDNGRGKNQMKVITAIIDKMTTGTTVIKNYSKILDSLEGMFRTSLKTEDLSKLVKMQLGDMASWNVQSFAVTGRGASEKTYSSPGHRAYVMYPNKESVAYASELVKRVLDGEILTKDDMVLPKR